MRAQEGVGVRKEAGSHFICPKQRLLNNSETTGDEFQSFIKLVLSTFYVKSTGVEKGVIKK